MSFSTPHLLVRGISKEELTTTRLLLSLDLLPRNPAATVKYFILGKPVCILETICPFYHYHLSRGGGESNIILLHVARANTAHQRTLCGQEELLVVTSGNATLTTNLCVGSGVHGAEVVVLYHPMSTARIRKSP